MSFWKHSARAATLALVLAPAWAQAHAHLESASPPVGGVVASPQEIRLTFSRNVEAKVSGVALSGPAGAVAVEGPYLAPGDARTLVVKIGQPLSPGAYNVNWRAISTDTHQTQGAFGFTVK